MAVNLGLATPRTKTALVTLLEDHYCELVKYQDYTFMRQLGTEGKDGRTFLVQHTPSKKMYAMKLFRKSKSRKHIAREVDMQKRAAAAGIAPAVVDFNLDGRYIVMDKLDVTLYEMFKKQEGQLTDVQQRSVLALFDKLDTCGVLHGDPNPLNFMRKGKRWYAIDYGFAKIVTPVQDRLYNGHTNRQLMTMGLIVQLTQLYSAVKLDVLRQAVV